VTLVQQPVRDPNGVVVVVSGLPRSGTSLMMQMLHAGGLPLVTDGVRQPDESNPRGYFELEAVKQLDRTTDWLWLEGARGRAIKITSPLLRYLPDRLDYRVILMVRNLDEVLLSQDRMLARGGTPAAERDSAALRPQFEAHLVEVRRLLRQRRCFEAIEVQHADLLRDAHAVSARVADFLGLDLQIARMAAVVDTNLYRSRRSPPAADA
jgi:hypothetical protein